MVTRLTFTDIEILLQYEIQYVVDIYTHLCFPCINILMNHLFSHLKALRFPLYVYLVHLENFSSCKLIFPYIVRTRNSNKLLVFQYKFCPSGLKYGSHIKTFRLYLNLLFDSLPRIINRCFKAYFPVKMEILCFLPYFKQKCFLGV